MSETGLSSQIAYSADPTLELRVDPPSPDVTGVTPEDASGINPPAVLSLPGGQSLLLVAHSKDGTPSLPATFELLPRTPTSMAKMTFPTRPVSPADHERRLLQPSPLLNGELHEPTPPCSNVAARPSLTSTDTSDDARLRLRRLIALRTKAIELRSSAREESVHMRNLNRITIAALYKCLAILREIKSKISSTSESQTPEWDDCLINIEDCIEESEQAERRFERNQDKLEHVEWRLHEQEHTFLGSHPPMSPTVASENVDDLTADEDTDESPGFGFAAGLEHFLGLSNVPVEDLLLDTPQQYEPSEVSNDDSSEIEDINSVFGDYELVEPEDSLFDLQSDDYAIIMDEEISALIEQARKTALSVDHLSLNSTNYEPSQDDLDRFFKWLAIGRPWSDRLADKKPEAQLSQSVLKLFRTWIWHTLELLSTGLQIPETMSAGAELHSMSLSKVKEFMAKNWMWDPHARLSIPKTRPKIPDISLDARQAANTNPDSHVLTLQVQQDGPLVDSNDDIAPVRSAYSCRDPTLDGRTGNYGSFISDGGRSNDDRVSPIARYRMGALGRRSSH